MPATTPPLLLYSHPRTGELLRRRWLLRVTGGNDEGATAEITYTPALVGAAPASTLVITDDTVSRYHVEIDVFAEGLRIRDLDSTNGTFVEDRRIKDAFIEAGAEFRAGRTSIRAIAEDEPAASEIDTDPRGVPPGAVETLGRALGVAGVTRELLRLVRKIAPSSSAVLFIGEEGTGKATLARLLHDLSPRREQPFVSISPRAAGDLEEIEARLFGRVARAGDKTARPGLFEVAKGGTLFIEGLEHMPETLHGTLLHTIESGEIQRPGDDRRLRVDVRLVSSSSRELSGDPRFDQRLARRAGVVRLVVPPLRDRSEDVSALAELFAHQLSGRELSFGRRALDFLRTQAFPGNLDQLRRLVASLLPEARSEPLLGPDAALARSLELAVITDHLERRRGNVTRAARELGIAQRSLFRYLAEHRVNLDEM